MVPNLIHLVSLRKGNLDTDSHTGRTRVQMGAEIRVMSLRAREHHGTPAGDQGWGTGLAVSFRALRGHQPCPSLDSPASRLSSYTFLSVNTTPSRLWLSVTAAPGNNTPTTHFPRGVHSLLSVAPGIGRRCSRSRDTQGPLAAVTVCSLQEMHLKCIHVDVSCPAGGSACQTGLWSCVAA